MYPHERTYENWKQETDRVVTGIGNRYSAMLATAQSQADGMNELSVSTDLLVSRSANINVEKLLRAESNSRGALARRIPGAHTCEIAFSLSNSGLRGALQDLLRVDQFEKDGLKVSAGPELGSDGWRKNGDLHRDHIRCTATLQGQSTPYGPAQFDVEIVLGIKFSEDFLKIQLSPFGYAYAFSALEGYQREADEIAVRLMERYADADFSFSITVPSVAMGEVTTAFYAATVHNGVHLFGGGGRRPSEVSALLEDVREPDQVDVKFHEDLIRQEVAPEIAKYDVGFPLSLDRVKLYAGTNSMDLFLSGSMSWDFDLDTGLFSTRLGSIRVEFHAVTSLDVAWTADSIGFAGTGNVDANGHITVDVAGIDIPDEITDALSFGLTNIKGSIHEDPPYVTLGCSGIEIREIVLRPTDLIVRATKILGPNSEAVSCVKSEAGP